MKARLDKQERRNSILAAAMPLFARHGFQGTTTRRIAEAAGISEALLYRHFANKRDIYLALRDFCCHGKEEVSTQVSSLPNSTATLVHTVYFIMAIVFLGREIGPRELRSRHDQLTRLMAHSILEKGNFARTFFEYVILDWREKWAACLAAAHEAGDLDHYDPAEGDSLLFGHHLAVSLLLFTLPQHAVIPFLEKEPMRLLDQAVRFALRGMGLKEEALVRHYQPQSLMLFAQSLFR
jgi:AcrR family transcriptional regulator